MTLWRAFLPSWRFFEAPDGSTVLFARCVSTHSNVPFAPLLLAPRRTLLSTWFAPDANLVLACHDLVAEFVHELAERSPLSLPQAEALPIYQLVQALTQYFLAARVPDFTFYQFKLVSEPVEKDHEVLFVSPSYPRV